MSAPLRRYRARHIFNRSRHLNGLKVRQVYDVPDDTDHIKRCGCGRVVAVKIEGIWREAEDVEEVR